MATIFASKTFLKVTPVPIPCPYFRPAGADSLYQLCGFCTGVPGSTPMIPSVEECAKWCCTPDHGNCPIYQSRRRREEERLGSSPKEQYTSSGVK